MSAFTHYTPNCKGAEWMAMDHQKAVRRISKQYTLTEDEINNPIELITSYGVLLDDLGLIGYGKTKKKALLAIGEYYQAEQEAYK